MRVIIKYDVTDEQRDTIDNKLSGKIRKRLATGNDIRELAKELLDEYAKPNYFDAVEYKSHGSGLVKCPNCDRIHQSKANQEHKCSCGTEFIAKPKG